MLPVELAPDENHYCPIISGEEQKSYAVLMKANLQDFWFAVCGDHDIEAPAYKSNFLVLCSEGADIPSNESFSVKTRL